MGWQDTFSGNWTDAFGATAGRVRPHRGTDLAVRVLPAWERLTVVNSDILYSSLGYCTIVRCDHGLLFGIAHNRRGTRAENGAVLNPGDTICEAALGPRSLPQSNANFPGTEWAGIHFHITCTNGSDPFGGSGLRDARPHIVEMAGGGGGGGSVNYAWGLTTAAQRAAQRALTKLGLYNGKIDGEFGPLSVKAMQQYLKNVGLLSASYDVDGIPGLNYGRAIQALVQPFGYGGPLDGEPGADTSLNLEKWAAKIMGEVVTPPTNPVPPVRPTPPIWAKTYPGAAVVVPSPSREPRKQPASIGYVILHGTANLADHTAYFSRSNEREVAPNLYARPSGEVKEFVRLGERAWTTAVPLDHQAVTWEIESDNKTFTDAQYESIAQFCAWLSQQKAVDSVPVTFTLDRQHVLGHKEVPGVTSGTSCPGSLDIDRIVKRAKEIVKPPVEMTEVPKAVWESWQTRAGELRSAIAEVKP